MLQVICTIGHSRLVADRDSSEEVRSDLMNQAPSMNVVAEAELSMTLRLKCAAQALCIPVRSSSDQVC